MINKDIKLIVVLGIIATVISCGVIMFFSYISALICFLLGVSLTTNFYIVTKIRYKKISELNNYLSLVCAGNYFIDINDNTEGELSILKNNLYKVIVLLRSKNQLLIKDKHYLADSLADISHQLKTPLTSLMVMVDLLKDEKDAEKQQEFISIIETQISKIKWLVENLLKLSKLDAGTIKFREDKVDVSSVITKSLSPFLVQMELKNIFLETTINDFSFIGDLNWTGEAIGNIIKNCIEHTPNGGKLNIETGVTNIYSYIKISDNGCGIKKKDLPHIFERFYQGENSSKESVGIGLALSKSIIESQKGSIDVLSEENIGTEFIVKLNKSIV